MSALAQVLGLSLCGRGRAIPYVAFHPVATGVDPEWAARDITTCRGVAATSGGQAGIEAR